MAEILNATPEDIKRYHDLRIRALSLDQPAREKDGEDSAKTLIGDRLPDPNARTPEQLMDSPEVLGRVQDETIKKLMRGLNPREKDIIGKRFLAEDPETLKEMGDALGISRERVRQLEVRALGKMKARASGSGLTADGLFTED